MRYVTENCIFALPKVWSKNNNQLLAGVGIMPLKLPIDVFGVSESVKLNLPEERLLFDINNLFRKIWQN